MQATIPMLAATEARLGTNGGEALAGPPLDRLAGHSGGKWVRTQIDWREDVEYAVEILVRNRSGLDVKSRDSIIRPRRSRAIKKPRRKIRMAQLLWKRLLALGVRHTRGANASSEEALRDSSASAEIQNTDPADAFIQSC